MNKKEVHRALRHTSFTKMEIYSNNAKLTLGKCLVA